uniref:KIB1-4 beta-propeller domain-containing protein n=1 Tax=Oryza barthii TaxID=65489 RepID=A0A0D3GWP4_9ORYZ
MEEETAVADWSALPDDVVITVMGYLADPDDLVRSGAGWLVTVDEAPNLHLVLVNPLTGAMATLPPITSLHNVERFTSRKGKTRYRVYDDMAYNEASLVYSPAQAREWAYHQVVLSCSPAEGSACVALLLHRPDGDERWTPVAYPGQACSTACRHAIYDDADGLFYTLRFDGSIYAIDVPRAASASSSPPPPPATREVMRGVTDLDNGSKYLVRARHVPKISCRFDYADGDDVEDEEAGLFTRQLQIFKVDGGEQKLVEASAASLEDHVLFLGYEFSACFPAEHFPALKPGCAYLADDHELVSMRKHCRRDIGRWDMKRGQMERLSGEDDVAAPSQPWLNWPTPV